MDVLASGKGFATVRIEEINVLQASLTYSDDLPMDPEVAS